MAKVFLMIPRKAIDIIDGRQKVLSPPNADPVKIVYVDKTPKRRIGEDIVYDEEY